MQVSATLKYARISPQKCRLVADAIRGKTVANAKQILDLMPKKGAGLLKKVLDSAIANAEHNNAADIDELKVATVFVNEAPRPSYFWMKNTYIPLDMLFIDARGRIVAIFANTTPHSLDPVGPDVPVKAILELRGGEAARRGIRTGDRVLHSAFR